MYSGAERKQQKQQQKLCEALYDYSPQQETELSLKKGDIISDVVENMDGWWTGVKDGQLGIFPSNYVKRLYAINIPVICVYDYDARSNTELSIKRGDIFIVLDKDWGGKWWYGIFPSDQSKRGWFPAPFVRVVDSTAASRTNSPKSEGRVTRQKPAEPLPEKTPRPKAVEVEKKSKDARAYVLVHVISAKGLKGKKKSTVKAWVEIGIKEGLLNRKKYRKIFTTNTIKKSTDPKWGEAFRLNVFEPESTELIVTVYGGKEVVGELSFPLRASKRDDFEVQGGQENWYDLGESKEQQLLLCIEYQSRSDRTVSKPIKFKKEQTIQKSDTGAFDLSNAPGWKNVFEKAGIDVNQRSAHGKVDYAAIQLASNAQQILNSNDVKARPAEPMRPDRQFGGATVYTPEVPKKKLVSNQPRTMQPVKPKLELPPPAQFKLPDAGAGGSGRPPKISPRGKASSQEGRNHVKAGKKPPKSPRRKSPREKVPKKEKKPPPKVEEESEEEEVGQPPPLPPRDMSQIDEYTTEEGVCLPMGLLPTGIPASGIPAPITPKSVDHGAPPPVPVGSQPPVGLPPLRGNNTDFAQALIAQRTKLQRQQEREEDEVPDLPADADPLAWADSLKRAVELTRNIRESSEVRFREERTNRDIRASEWNAEPCYNDD